MLGSLLQEQLLGRRRRAIRAANQRQPRKARRLYPLLFMAVGSAIAILLGHLLGAGRVNEAREEARKMIAFSVFMGILSGILVAACAPIFPQLYNTTNEVRSLAVSFTLVMAITSPMHSYLHASYFTLRSGGKTMVTFFFDSGFVWCVNVVLAFALSRYTTLPATYVYLIVQGVDIIKVVLGTFLVARGTWATDLTATHAEP